MKQTIRLTEVKLREFISETVREALNELDWRTYASAANKALGRGETYRADKFANHANNHIFKNAAVYKQSRNEKYPMYVEPQVAASPKDDIDATSHTPYKYKGVVFGSNGDKSMRSDMDTISDVHEPSASNFFNGDNGLAKRYKEEFDNFNNGKTKYVNGKGWADDVSDEKCTPAPPLNEPNDKPAVQKQGKLMEPNYEPTMQKQYNNYATDKITQSVFQKLKNRLKEDKQQLFIFFLL